MTLQNDAKFEEKPICCFKNDKNLVNFDLSTQNFHFDWSFLTSKSTEELSFMTLKSHVKFEEKPRLVVWKMTGIWQIFTFTFKIGSFMGSLRQKMHELKIYGGVV